jgi:hypothetical protein
MWADISTGDTYLQLFVQIQRSAGRWGTVLKRLLTAADKSTVADLIDEALQQLNWEVQCALRLLL